MIGVSVKMFMLPALMLRMVGKTALWVMIAFIMLEFIAVTVVALLMRKNPSKTIFTLVNETFGKVIAKVIFLFFALFLTAKCVLIISEIKMFFTVTMYEEIIWPMMIIPLLALIFAMARKRLRAIGRTAEILTPIVLVCTVILFTLLIEEGDLIRLLPVFGEGKSLFKGLTAFPMWFGDGFLALLFVGRTKNSEKAIKATLISYAVSSALVIAFTVMLCSTYANISTLIDYGNNVSNMTQFSLSSQDYGRFDLLFFCMWMFSVLITLALSFIFLNQSLTAVVGKRRKTAVNIISVLALYVLASFFLENGNIVFIVMTGIVKYILCPLPAIVPIVALIKSVVRKKNEEKESS